MSTTVTGPSPQTLLARLGRTREAAAAAGADAVLITPGSDLRYVFGVGGDSFERLTCLVVPTSTDRPAVLVVPKIEAPHYAGADALGVELAAWVDGEDPYALAAGAAGPTGSSARIAVSDFSPALHVLGLRAAMPGADQVLAGPIIRELRMRKDAAEVDELRAAAAAIDRVHARVGEWLRPGRTEAEIGADITAAIVEEGHTEAAFVIVGSGPNGASPHHGVSDRVVEEGDVVVVDIGGPLPSGYCSDSTRTYAVGTPRDADVTDTYAVLAAAQRAAVEAVRPGVAAEDVDTAARTVIADAGFGDHFIHRTGHGIGLDVHEEPYIVGGNTLALEPGMAFSVEPGIYQPGRWGARIEDIVVVTETGVEALNRRPRGLEVIG